MTIIELATLYRKIIEKAVQAALDDGEALAVPKLFPAWQTETAYAIGDRVCYGDRLYKCVQAHTSQENWVPPQTPALWTEVAKPGEIPVWRQPTGAQDAYMKGDLVWYPEKDTTVYMSLIDNNVYSPEAYPAGWEAQK